MGRMFRIVAGVAVAAIVLAGCRYGATYTINADDTVTGRIYTALYQDPTQDPVDDSVEAHANQIAASFTTASVTPHNEGDWVGYYIYLTNEPLSSFADPAESTWDIQIVKVGSQYQAFGYTATDDFGVRTSASDNSGYLELDVYFPGTLVEATGATETNVALGWAHFDLLAQPLNTTPYAKGNGPAAPPAPDPVVTVIIVPEPDPVVTPVVTPSASPSPSPSAIPVATESNDSIPVWVWAVGGVLVAALAGMIGFTLASRKTPAEVVPAARPKPKAKPKAVEDEPEEDEAEDDEIEEDEPEEETPPPKKKK